MSRSTRNLVGAALAVVVAGGGLAVAATAHAQGNGHTVVLHPGTSIQSAIDAAPPGTKIILKAGTYQGNLTITKSLQLKGDGKVVLEPAATFAANACTQTPDAVGPSGNTLVSGVCIGQIGPGETIINVVPDVTLSGFEIRGFSGLGIEAIGTRGLRVQGMELDHNGDYGALADFSSNVTVQSSRIHDNGNGGMHFSGDHGVTATDNRSYGNNAEGMLFGDSTGGRLQGNQLSDNCVGLVAVDTGMAGPVSDLRVTGNTMDANDRYCPGDPSPEGRPPEGGVGLALAGTRDAVVSGNRIENNALAAVPADGQMPPVQGGLALIDSTPFGGSAPSNNRINGNTIRNNQPFDVVTDGSGTGNVFHGNACATATMPGICR
jgi:parallel beta-helix repeat protein